MKQYRIILAAALAMLIGCVFFLDLYQYLTLEFFREQQSFLTEYVRENLALSVAIFFSVYVCATAISLPVAGVFCVVAGALFGVKLGAIVISFASTTGATLAFLISRFLLQDFVDSRFPHAAKAVNEGLQRDGPYYLFSLRLVPAFPYFVLNMVMGLTHMPVWTYAWVTQLSLLPITFVLTNAGEQLSLIKSPGDIISPELMGSLALVGVFPLLAKKLLQFVRR